MSGHTPGPWVVAMPDQPDAELVIVAASGTDDAEDVAILFAGASLHPNAPANAALIAAAPELLGALEALVEQGRDTMRHHDDSVILRAEAALIRARGCK